MRVSYVHIIKDVADFGETVYNQRTYTSFTDAKIAETDNEELKNSIYAFMREGLIDCFTDPAYFNQYLRGRTGARSSFGDITILSRGIYSETGQWDIGLSTKLLLGDVIKNRRNLPNFPNTYLGVLEQPNQFEGWPDKADPYSAMSGTKQKLNWAMSYYAALRVDAALNALTGADHFYSPYIPTPDWAEGKGPYIPGIYEVDYVRNVWYKKEGKYYHGTSFLFFDLIDDETGNWR